MTVFEAYITNLGKYAEGQLVGETLKFPATTEEVQSLLKNIGVDGVRYEEFFITAFDGDVMGLYEWVWYKSRATGFLNANRAPLKKSENILVFYQKSPVYHPQFTYGEPYRKTNPRSGCSTNYGKFERTGSESSDGRRYPGNVLFVPTVTGGIHPTQKPVELCEYFIKTYTDEGEVVADICAGSGTTAVAAMNTSRRFICFENAPSIYTIAAQRIEQARLAMAGGGKGE